MDRQLFEGHFPALSLVQIGLLVVPESASFTPKPREVDTCWAADKQWMFWLRGISRILPVEIFSQKHCLVLQLWTRRISVPASLPDFASDLMSVSQRLNSSPRRTFGGETRKSMIRKAP